ncbi:hypothetical protein [Yoonia sp. SS1-5]|uniref:Uncharacterized protein n=1 Tax=Yoonia rhodophyticola TaxID=3137370 RepID=A0AAN0ME30_9RHOB
MSAKLNEWDFPDAECNLDESPPDYQHDFVMMNETLVEWKVKLRTSGAPISLIRLLDNCSIIDVIDGNIQLQWNGRGVEGAKIQEALDTLHTTISESATDLGWPMGTSGFHLVNGHEQAVSRRGYISGIVKLNQEIQETSTPELVLKNERIIGVEQEMKNELDTVDADTLSAKAEYFMLIAETAAVVLGTKRWAIRGLSVTQNPDEQSRAVLAYCVLASRPIDFVGFAEYMNYPNVSDLHSDAAKGLNLVVASSSTAQLAKLLIGELSTLNMPELNVEEEEEADTPSYDDTVVHFTLRKPVISQHGGQVGLEQFMLAASRK